MATIEELAQNLRAVDNLFVITGAGISVASGIAPFRGSDPEAVWNQDVTQKGTFAYFREDVLGSWTWYLSRFSSLFNTHPNPAHFATADLVRYYLDRNKHCTLVTQNIDGLHKTETGIDVIEVHGSVQYVRCATTGCRFGEPLGRIPYTQELFDVFVEEPSIHTIPTCSECGDYLRPHVLWFDEYYTGHDDYRYRDVQDKLYDAQLCLCIGTSFSVGVTAAVIQHAFSRDIPLWVVDPVDPDNVYVHWINGKAEEVLPRLVASLSP